MKLSVGCDMWDVAVYSMYIEMLKIRTKMMNEKKMVRKEGGMTNNKTLGEMISSLRKEKGMTQSELAEKMNVTDKAVSKWERNLSCPDVNTIPKLAEIFGISVDELFNAQKRKVNSNKKIDEIINTALIAVELAMGVCVVVLSVLKKIEGNSALTLLGIGLISGGFYVLKNRS